MPQSFPSDWRDQGCVVVAVPIALVPYTVGLCKILENRGFWATDDDYLSAYTATYELERCFVTTCLSDLLDRQDRLYRLLDTALFGTEYTIVSETPPIASPAIPVARTIAFDSQDSVLGRLDRVTQLIDNSVNGTAVPLYAYDPSVKALLQSIIDALSTEDADLGSLLTELEAIAGLLA